MAKRMMTFTCTICGQTFIKWVGGIIMTPSEQQLMMRPICDSCKIKKAKNILSKLNR